MPIRMFLTVVSAIYAAFGVWCLVSPRSTSSAIGYQLTSRQALVEYVAVYGGLEIGLAIFFAAAALYRPLEPAALLLACVLHACIVAVRLTAAVAGQYWSGLLVGLLAVETGIAVGGAMLLRARGLAP